MPHDKDPYDLFSAETLRRAEALCSQLSSSLSLDRRGGASAYEGVVSDLGATSLHACQVIVAQAEGNADLTLISRRPLPACQRALLVFRRGPAQERKLIGSHQASRAGKRVEDELARETEYFTVFHIVQDGSDR